jgi:putative ABC transport system permease protein
MDVNAGLQPAIAVAKSSTLLPVTPVLGLVMAMLVVAAAGVAAAGRLGYGPAVLRSGVRAGLQLTAVSLVIATITRSVPLTGAFVVVMYLVAALEICRPHAATALIPALDQTRTVGLVTLPGAFVGMLLGGASPVAAGAVQLFVLIALLAVEAVAIVISIELAARGRLSRPDARRPIRARWWTAIADRSRALRRRPRALEDPHDS